MSGKGFRPSTAHHALGPDFFDPVAAASFPQTILRYRNQRWAERMGLGALTNAQWIDHFARFAPLPGSFETPLALRYHGHQFRSYNPQLGDGRGFLFAQGHDLVDGTLRDLGTKGSGQTPWSRGGDGRLTLKGGVREVLATAMLEALGVETSKSFSLIETGEALYRNDEPSPTRSAVLVRLSHSHIRIGTFERLAYLGDSANLRVLCDHLIAHYFGDLGSLANDKQVPALLERIVCNVARVGAQWIAAGFVHGVLNTDNINVTGESFDYGPWRLLPHYDPGFTAAYFDETGLYAFGRQPDALAWNLTRLAEALLPLSSTAALEPALNRFWPAFQTSLGLAVLGRLGLVPGTEAENRGFLDAFLAFMSANAPPYEQVYFDWRGGLASRARALAGPLGALYGGASFVPVLRALEDFVPVSAEVAGHPYFARLRPRTMLIDELEALWAPIAASDDWSGLEAALAEIEVMAAAYGHLPFTVN